MTKYLFFLVSFICFFGKCQENNSRPKVGLSLSGGGAKGFAHVGALKLIDSLGVKIDYVSGTSMGSIIGALYAAGYSANDIEKIVKETDFVGLLTNDKTREESSFFSKNNDKYIITVPIKDGKINVLPKAVSSGQKNIFVLKELLKNVTSIKDFSKLPIPYMCVATNLETGKVKVFEKGDLVNSIMASSAFPSLINPVKIEDSLYIDGAMTINYPSKPLKDKGMDIVIGVDLSQELSTRKDLNSALDILNQVIDFQIHEETQNQIKYTDINIHPNLKGLSALSYEQKNAIIDSGFAAAKFYENELSKLPKRSVEYLRNPANSIFSNIYKIDDVELINQKIFSKSYVLGKMNLKLPSTLSYGVINKMVDKLYATNNYKFITYDIVLQENRNILRLTVEEDETRYFLKFGLHYDTVFKTGLIVNFTAKRLLFKNSILSFDGVVGDRPRYYFNYFVDNGYIPGFGLTSSGMSFDLKNIEGNTSESWYWFRNEAFIQSVWKDKYAIGGGISLDYYETKLLNSERVDNENFVNPFVFVKSDTQDDKSFPTKGFYMNAEGKLLDLLNDDIEDKSLQIKGDLWFNLPLSSKLTYQLKTFGGFTFGTNLSKYYQFRSGGYFEQNINNIIRMNGYHFGSLLNENMILFANQFQYNLYKNFYLSADIQILNSFNTVNFENILKITNSSAGLTAGYKSPFGQVKINYSMPLKNGKGNFSLALGHWF